MEINKTKKGIQKGDKRFGKRRTKGKEEGLKRIKKPFYNMGPNIKKGVNPSLKREKEK